MHLRDLGSSLPFAHLLGLAPATGPKAMEDDGAPKGPPRPQPGAHLAGAPTAEEKPAEGGPKDKPAEGGGEKEKLPAEADPPPADPEQPAEKSEAKAEDAAVRIQAIVTSPHAAGSYAAVAAFFAFNTQLGATDAVTALQLARAAAEAEGKGRGKSLDDRMQAAGGGANPQPGTGGAAPQPEADGNAIGAAMVASARKARGLPD